MARLTQAEISTRLNAARMEGREPMPQRAAAKPVPPAVRRLNAILERRARGF